MRARRYGSASAKMSASTASTPRIVARWPIFTPAAMSSEKVAKQTTIAVPMSGCFRRSRQAAPTTIRSGRHSVFSDLSSAGRDASRPAE